MCCSTQKDSAAPSEQIDEGFIVGLVDHDGVVLAVAVHAAALYRSDVCLHLLLIDIADLGWFDGKCLAGFEILEGDLAVEGGAFKAHLSAVEKVDDHCLVFAVAQ